MAGYYNRPDATREVIDGEGWLHTGDVGELDQRGFLRITDRKKDLIKTAGGKYVAPQPIENMVKTSKFVLNAVVLGDRRPFPIVLIVPNWDAIRAWAAERRLQVSDLTSALRIADVTAKLEREVMGRLRDLASYEMPKKVVVIERDFTLENGELTPTLKVKRRVVEEHYRGLINSVYAQSEARPERSGARGARRGDQRTGAVSRSHLSPLPSPVRFPVFVPIHAPGACASGSTPGARASSASTTSRSPGSSTRAASATQAGPAYSPPTTTPRAMPERRGMDSGACSSVRYGAGSTPAGAFTAAKCTPSIAW
jgi:long-chain acyl-CoA synthetase